MAAKTKKYLITKESHEIFIVRRNGNETIHGFCPECEREVEMWTFDAATTNTGKRTRRLFQLVENNLIHSIETTTGHLLVCRNSLRKMDE